MARELTPRTSLENCRLEAKRWLKALRDGDAEAQQRFQLAYPQHSATPVLREVQHALAREYGSENWKELSKAIQKMARQRMQKDYEQAARDYVAAYDGEDAALARLNQHYGRAFTHADLRAEIWRRDYAYRQRSSRVPHNYLPIEEAQLLIAQDAGYGSWDKLMQALQQGVALATEPYRVGPKNSHIGPARRLAAADWDAMLGVMKERRIPALDANGIMTDDALARVAELDFVKRLSLGGSRELTDDGLLHLARMPQLEELDLNEYPGGRLTDRGMEVLRHLPNLRKFQMTWQAGITDRGLANLRHCARLEEADLMGSPTGNGVIEALQGMPHLRNFRTGRLVTDAGLALLGNFPLLRHADEQGARLLLDGPFTDAGMGALRELEGVFDLDLFWHVDAITNDGFAHLAGMPNVRVLGCDGNLSNDATMVHLANMPRLERLRIQESVASEEGFIALARSRTISGIWGRVCAGFGSRAFVALSQMPSLRTLGIGCANVDDAALARLPHFPALRELTPIGFTDDGFRHIGACRNLERLTCMYCRETGDAATEHIRGLNIRYYYAGLTQITDRSLEILGAMDSLEQVELYECLKVTDAGLPVLARLPRLREVHLDGLPGVTSGGTKVFPSTVDVHYST